MKNSLEAIEWFKQIQGGAGIDRSIFPDQLKSSEAKELWGDFPFTLGLEYGVLIALIELYSITPDMLKLNIASIPYEQYKLVMLALVRKCVEDNTDPFELAAQIRKELTEKLNIKWEGPAIITAVAQLCNHWHNQTTDRNEQAIGITNGILSKLSP